MAPSAIDGLVTVLTLIRSALAIHTALTEAATAANWQLAVAKAAAQGLGAVVIAAAIVVSVGGLLVYQSGVMKFAAGGSALLTGPTLILAGEVGPELATLTPGTGAPLATMTRTIEHTIIEPDPQEAARKAVEYILSLTQPGR